MSLNTLYYPFYAPPVTGGDYIAVEHIAALNRLGFDAKALYLANDDGQRQFTVPVVDVRSVQLKPDDIVIIGEVHRAIFNHLRNVNCVKVLHNQNPYYTFFGFDSVQDINNYPFTHVITLSDYSANKLRDIGITKPIKRIRPALPPSFRPAEKLPQIAYTPYKRPQEPAFIMGYFRSKFPDLAHIPWIPLFRISREACAQVLAQSPVYAAFPLLEGLGLMNLEAMASGCHVVGYLGHAGVEYATNDNGFWINDGDHDTFVQKLRQAFEMYRTKAPNSFIESGLETARLFSLENFEMQVKETYMDIMGSKANLFRK